MVPAIRSMYHNMTASKGKKREVVFKGGQTFHRVLLDHGPRSRIEHEIARARIFLIKKGYVCLTFVQVDDEGIMPKEKK